MYGTMLPFDFSASSELIQWRLRRLWERPIRGLGGSWSDVYSNILFFMPWGLLLAIWRAGRGSSWWSTVVLAMLSGACLERIGGVCPVIRPGTLPVGHRPGDQHIRLGCGSFGRLAPGALDLASRVGPDSSVAAGPPGGGVCAGCCRGFAGRRSLTFVYKTGRRGSCRLAPEARG